MIQILKYHRDVYYSRINNGDKLKPISAIITTLVTEISKNTSAYTNVMNLLEFVVSELNIYSNYQTLSYKEFITKYDNKCVIKKENNQWILRNPANPEDNLTDSWNDNTSIEFFKWVKNVENTLIESTYMSDNDFRLKTEQAFGYNAVNNIWKDKYRSHEPENIETLVRAKPWREDEI